MSFGGGRRIALVGGILLFLPMLAASLGAVAQTADLQMGVTYQCPRSVTFKVLSCTGPGDADPCDVEAAIPGQPLQRGKSTRQQAVMLAAACHPQSPAEAQAASGSAPGSAQVDLNGFKIGDEVSVATAGGWNTARILRANGDSYYVRLGPSLEVWKSYPGELRRIGPLTDVDRARGLFALHDKVQVNVEGRWEEGEIISELGMEYQVQLAGGRAAWATGPNLRRVAVAEKPVPKAGVAPRPGLESCAGKVEGRYALTSGVGGMQITFRSGKAMLRELNSEEEFECWMDGEKIYLHKAGESSDADVPIDINDDGTLETPLGEIKKKGK